MALSIRSAGAKQLERVQPLVDIVRDIPKVNPETLIV
jgi:hypothetical protein